MAQQLVVGIDIKDQTLPFMFEVMDTATNLPSAQYVLPLPPEAYRKSETPRATLTQTLGGAWEDVIGMGFAKVSLQGTFGFLGTLPGGNANSLSAVQKDGWALFKEVEQVLLDFYDRFGTTTDSGALTPNPVDPQNLPELRFYNFTDEDYFVIQLNKFDVTRSIQRRFLYQYDIQMTVKRRIINPSEQAEDAVAKMLLSQIPVPQPLTLWQTLLQGYSSVYGGISDIINTVENINQNINTVAGAVNGFIQGGTNLILCPVGLLQTVVSDIDSITNKIVDVPAIPYEFTADLRSVKRDMLQLGLRSDLFSATTATATAATASTAITATEIITAPLPQSAASAGVVLMNTPETTLFDPTLESIAEVAASEVAITQDDNLSTLARKYLGDATAWGRIALLNDLEYPFIVQEPIDAFTAALGNGSLAAPASAGDLSVVVSGLSPTVGNTLLLINGDTWESATINGVNSTILTLQAPLVNSYPVGTKVTCHQRPLAVLVPGQKIQIPGGTSSGAPIIGDATQANFYTKIFGTDEYLDDDGAHDADPGGDVATTSGLDNLSMALRHRLRTVRGELAAVGHPQYGSYLPLIVGKINSQMWYQRAIVEAKITILEDPRVSSIGQVKFRYDATAIYLEADVFPINQTAATQMSILVN
jgi:hypothetical protein